MFNTSLEKVKAEAPLLNIEIVYLHLKKWNKMPLAFFLAAYIQMWWWLSSALCEDTHPGECGWLPSCVFELYWWSCRRGAFCQDLSPVPTQREEVFLSLLLPEIHALLLKGRLCSTPAPLLLYTDICQRQTKGICPQEDQVQRKAPLTQTCHRLTSTQLLLGTCRGSSGCESMLPLP